MANTPKIALIITSTRAARAADIFAQWMLAQAQARTDMTVELVDLRDFALPLFDEPASNAYMPSSDPAAVAWKDGVNSENTRRLTTPTLPARTNFFLAIFTSLSSVSCG
jgi:NAD(P)H-dependent FMN reductase